MIQKVYQPHPDLAEFVNYIAIYDNTIPLTDEPPILSVPPLPEKCICIYPFDCPEVNYLKQGKTVSLPPSVVVGRILNRVELKLGYRNLLIKVSLHPSALFRLTEVNMNEYPIDEAQDSRLIIGEDIENMHSALQKTSDYDTMIDIIQVFLRGKFCFLPPALRIDSVLSEVIENGGDTTVEEMAKAVNISVRQLERQMQQRVGMPPAFFIRLCRFAKAWGLKEEHPTMSWTNIVYQSGYYDQMHFIRDFKEFAGLSPSVIEAKLKKEAVPLTNRMY
jgi:AraC-like DNA-binding protein